MSIFCCWQKEFCYCFTFLLFPLIMFKYITTFEILLCIIVSVRFSQDFHLIKFKILQWFKRNFLYFGVLVKFKISPVCNWSWQLQPNYKINNITKMSITLWSVIYYIDWFGIVCIYAHCVHFHQIDGVRFSQSYEDFLSHRLWFPF